MKNEPQTKPEDNTEIYEWINNLSASTGLGVDTLSDLYLRGFIVRYEDYETVDKEGRPIQGTKLSFWKQYPDQ